MTFCAPFLLALRHAEHCHKLEKEREHYIQEWQAGQSRLDALQKALEEHQVLLSDKVHVITRNFTWVMCSSFFSRNMKWSSVSRLQGRKSGKN